MLPEHFGSSQVIIREGKKKDDAESYSRTALRLRCTQTSLSGCVPAPTAAWNSTCWPAAEAIEMIVGLLGDADADVVSGRSRA